MTLLEECLGTLCFPTDDPLTRYSLYIPNNKRKKRIELRQNKPC